MEVSVLGCGLIGASWSALFAAVGGHNVRAWDPSDGAREAFAEKVERARAQLIELGATGMGEVAVCERIEQAVHGADWVQENAPEKLELKHGLYQHVEAIVSRDAVIATSTSSFTWSQLSAELEHSNRFVVAHPFNPPHLVPLVELYCPDAAVLDRAVSFYRDLGRVPVCIKKEAVGHIGNRLASALWREAVHIVADGIADVEDVDKVLIHGPGLRWSVIGTHLGYHLGGGDGGIEHYLRHLGASQERRWSTLGNPKLTEQVCEQLAAGVAREADGRSVPELEAERDRQLTEILRLRAEHPTIDASKKTR